MIGEYSTFVAIQVGMVVADGPDDSQGLQLCDPVVSLLWGKCSTRKGNRVNLAITLSLCENSSLILGARISFLGEVMFKVRERQDRSFSEAALEFVKR